MEAKTTLSERYAEVRRRIAAAAVRSRRRPEEIMLVAVTKTAEPEQIRTLLELGHRDFGENRVQRLVQRASMVREWFERVRVLERTGKSPEGARAGQILTSGKPEGEGTLAGPARWHLIGHLQRNKVRRAMEHARLIHSVDSLRLVEELQAFADRRDRPIDVLIQVNCSGESSKFGCPVPAALPLAEQIDTMINVRVRGLMTIAPYSDDPEQSRPIFSRCFDLFQEIRRSGIAEGRFNILSMGMTNDFEVAIEEGANLVRVGRAIFGEPSHPETDDEAPELDADEDASADAETEHASSRPD